ncbi:MAG TPA: gluconeogenesis factor YvcK family protein [Candidatus Binatia bacterium]|nr:gluconeogenesis factor YvcK family protein [Candidatus Binatia bacterium]
MDINVGRDKLRSVRQWLTPGMRIKRWLILGALGAVMVGAGIVYFIQEIALAGQAPVAFFGLVTLSFLPPLWRVVILVVAGGIIVVVALTRLGRNLVEPFRRPGDSIGASLYAHSRRGRGPHIVAIGGGTGLPALLRGLKEYTSNITAIVTVADDGGSSGRLRQELGMLPPGDFRNNIAALSRDEALMTQLLQYRFGAGAGETAMGRRVIARELDANGPKSDSSGGRRARGELEGHAFGNLLLAALAGVTGSFDEALLAAERVLAMQGRVLPSTLELVTLVADVQGLKSNGEERRIAGESAITKAGGRIRRIYLEPAKARAYPPAVQAILQAELVIIGPGSLYTSIMPNLLVGDVANALRHTRAPVVYICNLATQPGETDRYNVADHVRAITENGGGEFLDFVVANNNLSMEPETLGNTVLVQPEWPPQLLEKVRLVQADLVDEARPWRHDSRKLARAVRRIMGDSE